MGAMASLIISLTIVYSTDYSDADQRKHQSSASLNFVRGIHRGPVNFPHKWPATRKMSPFDGVIMWHANDHPGFAVSRTQECKIHWLKLIKCKTNETELVNPMYKDNLHTHSYLGAYKKNQSKFKKHCNTYRSQILLSFVIICLLSDTLFCTSYLHFQIRTINFWKTNCKNIKWVSALRGLLFATR